VRDWSGWKWGWLAVPVSVLVGDFLFRWEFQAPANLTESPSNLVASMGLSFVLWWAASRLVSATERRWWWAAAIAIPAAFLCASAWHFHQIVGHDPSAAALVYVWQQPASSMRMMGSQISALFVAGCVALALLWVCALAGGPRTLDASLRRNCLVALVPWFLAAILWPAGMTVGQTPFVTDFHLTHNVLLATRQIVTGEATSPLGVADRVDVPSPDSPTNDSPQRRPNIIVVVAESLRRDRMQVFGHSRPTTPNMASFFDAHPHEIYRFDRALSASAYTQLSVPAILSGLYMAHERTTMHRAPLLWHYAKSVDAQTFLVSPQQWNWQGLDDFLLLDTPPDYVVTAETLGAEIINDAGVHDALATDKLVEIIKEDLEAQRAFLGVVQTNATHFPFLPADVVSWPQETIRDVYDAAVALSDETFGRMIEALAQRDFLEDTVIIFVSDHSEFFYNVDANDREQVNKVWQDGLRISSCHPAIVRIPMFMYVPQKWQQSLALDGDTIRANQHRQVSTVDVAATILDLWGLEGRVEAAGVAPLDGQSIVEPIGKDRVSFCFNSARWNLRQGSGFGAFDARHALYGRTDFEHLHAYDPASPATWTERKAGEPATTDDLGWLEEVAEQTPFIRPYIEHVRRP
jgi:glucan phosphoethanolaminetransferase (alkaline phosphatase superfamily)